MSHTALNPNPATATEANEDKVAFGFWVYLMTDCVLFASLFATYAVLHNATFGGPGSHQLFDLPFVLTETIILLTSSFTCGLGLLAARTGDKAKVYGWYAFTFLLGVAFLALEISEFSHLVSEGNGPARSAFLSGFFTLVGTHGAHITSGLIWMLALVPRLVKGGLTPLTVRKLTLLSLFWHFLDIVWIFIFTIVYLLGVS